MKTKTLTLTGQEIEDIYFSLSCRLGIIETGNPSYRAKDIQNGAPGKLRALSPDQMKLIIRVDELMQKLLQP